ARLGATPDFHHGLPGSPAAGGGQAAGRGAAAPSPYPVTQGKASRFEKIAEGVYYGTGSSGGNSPVIVGDREALIIDTKTTPAAALALALKNWDDLQEITPTAPNVTYKDKKVIDLGGREVQLLFLGRGHTNGDTVVYLPSEKIVCTGDLMELGPAYMGDGQFDEWIASLESLKKMDFEIVLPGHGTPCKDGKQRITAFQGYLRDAVKQTDQFRKQGLTAEQAAQKIDLSAYKEMFPATARP